MAEADKITVSPSVSTLTKAYYATSLTGEKTGIGYIQEIPEFITTPEEITYSALDIDDERMAKGRRKAESFELPFLFTEEQWDEIRALEDTGDSVYWFIQLPEETAVTSGKPLTFYFTGKCATGMDTISIDDMIQAKVKIYRDSAISESKGFPSAS